MFLRANNFRRRQLAAALWPPACCNDVVSRAGTPEGQQRDCEIHESCSARPAQIAKLTPLAPPAPALGPARWKPVPTMQLASAHRRWRRLGRWHSAHLLQVARDLAVIERLGMDPRKESNCPTLRVISSQRHDRARRERGVVDARLQPVDRHVATPYCPSIRSV